MAGLGPLDLRSRVDYGTPIVLEHSFSGETLPGWWSSANQGGSGDFDAGERRLSATGTASTLIAIDAAPTINLQDYMAVALTVRNLHFGKNAVFPRLGVFDGISSSEAEIGAMLRQQQSDVSPSVRGLKDGVDVGSRAAFNEVGDYYWAGNFSDAYKVPITWTFLLYPQHKWLYILNGEVWDGAVWQGVHMPDAVMGLARPRLEVSFAGSGNRWAKYAGVQLATWALPGY